MSWLLAGACLAAAPVPGLPGEVESALKRAKLPPAALFAVVQEVGKEGGLLSWNDQAAVNPASVFKLVTTYAALDLLGPAWSWSTPVYVSGTLRDGVLDGSVAIRGRGDPTLVVERVWLLLRRLQQLGLREIRGDIVLDHSAFAPSARAPGDFDNEPFKPQNVQPDALLMNFQSVTYSFAPEPALGIARVGVEPVLAGVQVDPVVPLSPGPCDDWRAALKPRLDEPTRVRFAGAYPLSCGERSWPLATGDASGYAARLVEQLWRELGGRLTGRVRDGAVPADARLLFEQPSRPLAEVVRDINKFSNNAMAEQLFLSLAVAAPAPLAVTSPVVPASPASAPESPVPPAMALPPPARPDDARELLHRWLRQRFGERAARETVIDNGSGLSRDARISARLLAQLLQAAWSSGVMPELMSSLPISGTDGTLKRSTATPGRAHLKTGSLRDVAAVAGYVLSNSGRRYVLVAIVNHDNAAAARPAFDALVQWAIHDTPNAGRCCSPAPP
ncbi:MAG TPA: D-alanyl-D-alanine carboxypeptidase/D-alanyl-D-alanine-endopeptidase [Ideonella sp.]|nr:D-alanyl-D-alanine carboxypeptidase/D-alanyl-D-alanine-endopeptidase [Ideonella sp.]